MDVSRGVTFGGFGLFNAPDGREADRATGVMVSEQSSCLVRSGEQIQKAARGVPVALALERHIQVRSRAEEVQQSPERGAIAAVMAPVSA